MLIEGPSANIRQQLVNLHIVGAQKSGTSALAHFLHQHKDIYVVDGKEAHVFDSPQFLHSATKMQTARQAFKAKLCKYEDETYICDATPITWVDTRFLTHCYAYNKNAKFIVILRDPNKRAYSHYKMSVARGQEKSSFLCALLKENIRLKKHQSDLSFTSPWRHQSYLYRGRYSEQLRNLFSIVPAKQVLVLYQEDLLHHHDEILNRVFSFLNICKQEIPPAQVFIGKKVKATYSDTLGKLISHCYFWFKGENKRNWENIIQREKENADVRN